MEMVDNKHKDTYIVMGCGYFGLRAVKGLKSLSTRPFVIAVDHDRERLEGLTQLADQVHHGDGVKYLLGLTEPEAALYWIVPALPVHLAHAWLLTVLNVKGCSYKAKKQPVPLDFKPAGVLKQHRTPAGTLYCSFGDFTCPEDCSEPKERCYITDQPRPSPLYRILGDTPCTGYRSLVVHSQLILPGVGGYLFNDLLMLQAALAIAGGKYLLSTACTCHGVTDAISINVAGKEVLI